MIAPTLLVGLGGTGSKIVCRVSKLVSKEQRDHLGFAVFDTDINELRDIQRANPHIKIIQTSTRLSVGEYLNIDTHARDTWFPVNAILNSKTLTEGAGQVRAISRLAFDTAVRAGKLEQLHEAIQDLYKVEEGQSEQALRVIIVSSLAGGTGSGLILPVALYIKNYLATHFRQSANITRGFFILPEVFDEVIPGQAERSSLRSNAYATLRELDAFLMKGDNTLPERYQDSVKMEFPRAASNGYEEYKVRPYDFCFLFDAQNAEGSKLNSFNQYLDHAANCIYAQSIGPMNKRSNSSEDNTIRRLCEERGRNRYAGAGSSMLIYPVDDVKEYIALNWAKECVSSQWMTFDHTYNELRKNHAAMRAQGISVADDDQAMNYITTVETAAKDKNAFARAIKDSCNVYAADGITVQSDKWTDYVSALLAKIRTDESSGQPDLDAQKQVALTSINRIEGGEGSWELLQEAYRELEKYRAMITRRCEDAAHTIAYTMFKAPNSNVTTEKVSHRMETYLRDSSGQFIHPNAVRYFLYKTESLLKVHKQATDAKNRATENYFTNFANNFDDPKTEDVVETVENLSDRKISLLNKMRNKLSPDQQNIKEVYDVYLVKANEYRINAILAEVLAEAIDYVHNLSEGFQSFYASFDARIAGIDRKITNIAKKYDHSKGTTARYVCASPACLNAMADEYRYAGSAIAIDSRLTEDIYSRVRRYSMMEKRPQDGSYFEEIFEKGILGYFKSSLMEMYGANIDMDIIDALEEEAKYEEGLYNTDDVAEYVRKVIRATRALSCPFIEKPLGEEKQPIYACAFNTALDPHDGSVRTEIIGKELKNAGGVEDDDIGKNMILFYQSFYGLRANDLSKFAPPEHSITSTRDGGEYYKAYFELIKMIHPEPHLSKAITPHIDRWWHVITKMPDLDEKNQEMQEQKIYAAFFWGLLCDYVNLYDVGADQRAYRLQVDDLGMSYASDILTVSNGTVCDRLYEVLDAFAIYPELVEKILEKIAGKTEEEYDQDEPLEEGLLRTSLDEFRIKEYPLGEDNRVRSIFDMPYLMKKSTRSDSDCEDDALNILKAEITEIRRYLSRFCTAKELPEMMGEILKEQFERYLDDMAIESQKSKNLYQDYLFSRTCSIIADAFEKLGLNADAKEVRRTQKELSR